MKFFKFRKNLPADEAPAVVQTTERRFLSPFDRLMCFDSRRANEYELYRQLRQTIPIIDAAIGKLVLLMGDFRIRCDDSTVEQELNRFFKNVRCGGFPSGFPGFMSVYMNQLLTYGTAVGEIVPTKDGRDIYSLVNVPLETVRLAFDENYVDTLIYPADLRALGEPFEHQELLLLSVLDPEPGKPDGTSILASLRFVSNILTSIYNTIGQNWRDAGNVRFAVTYKPNGPADRTLSRQRVEDIAEEWSKVMRDEDTLRDFVSVGDISVKVIGNDSPILNSEIPVREMLEQIIAKLSIPPCLLGISWSTPMSSQQSDVLISEIEYYRRIFDGVIIRIADIWQNLHGCSEELTVEWSRITIGDNIEKNERRSSESNENQ